MLALIDAGNSIIPLAKLTLDRRLICLNGGEAGAVYGTEVDYLRRVRPEVEKRRQVVHSLLREAFEGFTSTKEEIVINFERIDSSSLAEIIRRFPAVLKPLIAYSGMGSRTFQRDLKMENLDTYSPKLTVEESLGISNVLKSALTTPILLPTIVDVDAIEFADKEKRRIKGAWEELVRQLFQQESGETFVKRRFGEKKIFEIDLAYPGSGPIEIGIDVKRVEARRDHQKRSDEIVNKATALKKLYPSAKFAAFIYYPFDHKEVRSRLASTSVDLVVFAGEDMESVRQATREVLRFFQFGHVQRML